MRICRVCWLGIIRRRVRWFRVRRIRWFRIRRIGWFWVRWVRRRRVSRSRLLRIRLAVDSNDSDENDANEDLIKRIITQTFRLKIKMLALDPKMSLYLHVDAVMVWMRLMLLNAALPSFYTPSRFERSCTTGLVMPLYYTLRSVTCSVCTSLTHFSTRVQSERFTLAACQRPSRWAFLAPARKLCAFAAVIYTVMTSTHAALHDSPINPYYLSRFICLAHCEWWGQQPRSRYAC